MTRAQWYEPAAGVLVRRYRELDQTLGLVLGDRRCLVVDTGRDEVHGAEFAAAVRQVTSLPPTVVITHAHWDHFFGTAAFPAAPVWAHERCRDAIATSAEAQRAEGRQHYVEQGERRFADDLEGYSQVDPARVGRRPARVIDGGDSGRRDDCICEWPDLSIAALAVARTVLPTHLLTDHAEIDLGGRTVRLIHPGRGHTDHDVVIEVGDAGVVFAGDLVEQGAPPSIGPDAHPEEWRHALDRVLALDPEVIVPGHGEPVGRDFVVRQRQELAGAYGIG